MTEPRFTTAAEAMADWKEDVLTGTPPTLYPVGEGTLSRIEIGPDLVTLIGGAPGAGKTAFAMQLLTDALRLTASLRLLVCNVEMPKGVLLDRQLSRLSGVDLTAIRYRRLGQEHAERIERGMATLEELGDRLGFLAPPFDLENTAAAADAFEADILLLDYIQRIPPPGDHGEGRGAINATMSFLRKFAEAGVAVVVVSAVTRGRDSKGRSTYSADALNLASYRESGELEYGCDDAFLLAPDDEEGDDITLRHLKSRHGETVDIPLRFCKSLQRFEPTDDSEADRDGLAAEAAALWK